MGKQKSSSTSRMMASQTSSENAGSSSNGKEIAKMHLEEIIPIQIGLGEGLDIGKDVGSAADFTCQLPFKFTGTIEQITVELK